VDRDKFIEIYSDIVAPDLGGYSEGHAGGSSVRKVEGQILYKICRAFKPKKLMETGTHVGCSTNYLLQYAQEEGATVYSFDVDSNAGKAIIPHLRTNLILCKPKKQFWSRGRSQERIETVRRHILETARQGIDFFFHDSDHRYENAKWEFENVAEHMRKGSAVVLHDVLNETPEHQTHKLFAEVVCSWKHIFDTPNGLGLIVL
jgi:predicted O-methyltransferase YrrM